MRNFLILLFFIFLSVKLSAQNDFERLFNDPTRGVKEQMTLNFIDSFNQKTILPIVIIKGQQPGKVFTILAGVHGAELAPIIATKSY